MTTNFISIIIEPFNKLNPIIKGFILLGIVFYLLLSPVIIQLINFLYLMYCIIKTLEAQQTANIEAFVKATNLFLSYFIINIFTTFNLFNIFSNMFCILSIIIFVNNFYNIKNNILEFIKKVYDINKIFIDKIVKFIDTNLFDINKIINYVESLNKKNQNIFKYIENKYKSIKKKILKNKDF